MSTSQPSRFTKVRPLPLAAARWTRGFWADRFSNCRDVMIPTMGRLMSEAERPRFVGNFEVANGSVQGRHRGPKWNDGDFYKWLEAAAATLAFAPDEKLDAEIDSLIALIARTQERDGYIHTDVQIAQRAGQDVPRFGNPMDFEMYNHGHLISAACVHHAATGKTNLLAVARRAADYLAKEFATPTPEQARHGICPSHLMALIELARTTGEPRYRDLAVKLLDMRDLVTNGDDDNQDRIPLRQQTTAHGHAVRATYLYAGAIDVFAETGDISLLKALAEIFGDLVSRKVYITGGCGALFDGASPDGAIDQSTITRVHQAFGRDYQLPNSTAHNETCAAIGNLLWNWRMFLVMGDARFADLLEIVFYNSVLAGVSLDGTSFFYTNTLRQLEPMPTTLRQPRHRQKTLGCFCCPPNVARTIAQSSQYAYAVSDHAIYVVLYGSAMVDCTLPDGTPVKLTQMTDYPWDGRVRITIDATPPGGREFSLMLRISRRNAGATVRVNGGTSEAAEPVGGFCDIRRVWAAGDVVELDLPMRVRLVEAHPLVEESRNHVAVMRGPIVYCLEAVDLPQGVKLLDVHVPRAAEFSVRPITELGGAVALHGKGVVYPNADWGGRLYREFVTTPPREIDLVLIPYYAWDNRGESEMSVWLPLAH